MEAAIQEMLDHHEIRKVLALYCHASDRVDADLMASLYAAEGSFDDHGVIKGPGPYYAREITAMVKDITRVMLHSLGQSIIEVDGAEARAETTFLALMTADGDDGTPRLSQLGGRFVDRLERKDGAWRIKHRIAIHDLSITHRIEDDFLAGNGLTRGTREPDDPGAALMGLVHRPRSAERSQSQQ